VLSEMEALIGDALPARANETLKKSLSQIANLGLTSDRRGLVSSVRG